ncbi:RelA/SpoT domain protein [Peptoniphilus sp. oral taxon 375 str. F0436]|nr:RelA/SpoT domain protein [Peptoniphilus sp. oral taxon 375 str. F0436]
MMKVEIQFRTISMDCWASLEHKIRYKKGLPQSDFIEEELVECAKMSSIIDARMENLYAMATDLVQKDPKEEKIRPKGGSYGKTFIKD